MGIGEILEKILEPALADTAKLIRLMALIAVTCLVVAGAALLLMRFLPARSQITIPVGKSGNVVFERHSSDYETDYVVLRSNPWRSGTRNGLPTRPSTGLSRQNELS